MADRLRSQGADIPAPFKIPPTVLLNPDDGFGWIRLIAALVWGNDRQKMNRALATYASDLFGALQNVQEAGGGDTATAMAGVPPSALPRMPNTATFLRACEIAPREVARLLNASVFQPAGHHRAVADAPGTEALLADYRRAVRGGALNAAFMLFLVATMRQNHPQVPASLNRAIAIMERWGRIGQWSLPTDRTLLKAWKDWRGLAPLWIPLIGYGQARGGAAAPPGAHYESMLEALHSPATLRRIAAHAAWFREFATTYTPEGAQAPLIPASEAVVLADGVPAEEPPLNPLPPADLEAALLYRAPTRKFWRPGQ